MVNLYTTKFNIQKKKCENEGGVEDSTIFETP
jgi:hypothetical protein